MLFSAVDQLAAFPGSGRMVPEYRDATLRELVRPPYRIVYERTASRVIILTIFHAARMFPAGRSPGTR